MQNKLIYWNNTVAGHPSTRLESHGSVGSQEAAYESCSQDGGGDGVGSPNV